MMFYRFIVLLFGNYIYYEFEASHHLQTFWTRLQGGTSPVAVDRLEKIGSSTPLYI